LPRVSGAGDVRWPRLKEIAMPPVIAWLLGITVVLGVVFLIVVTRRHERERTEALRRVAETAGLTFEPDGQVEAVRSRADSTLFERGHSRKVKNLMSGRVGDTDLLVFDYHYTTGHGKNQHTTAQTVVVLPAAKRSLPDLQMAPENAISRIAEKFGYQDIDIESSPEFSRRYIVKGPDEAAIRAALYPSATSYFGGHEGWTVEVRSGNVAIYRAGKRPKADDVPSFIEEAREAARNL
jgi:hypothetical protein